MLVIVPSRGRPENIERLLYAWRETGAVADLLVATDLDDPTVCDYPIVPPKPFGERPTFWYAVESEERAGLVGTLNRVATREARFYDYLGFMGDDHLPKTDSWDSHIVDTLEDLGTGIVYGNDLLQGERLPTAVFLTSDIVRALGYMAIPACRHMYVDNGWRLWGESIDRLRYLPDVVIEHLHYTTGKSSQDASYLDTNSNESYSRDREAYHGYLRNGGLLRDSAKLQALIAND